MTYFRSYNDGQTKQIDDESVFMFQYVNPVTIQANNFSTTDWPLSAPHMTSPYVRGRDVTISGVPQSVDVVASFEGTVHCWGWVQSRTSNSVVVRVYSSTTSNSSGSCTIRIWANRIPTTNTQYGLRLRDGTSSNNIIYDSGAKVMRPLGFVTPDGYTGISTSGKSLAHVPQQWGTAGFTRNEWGAYGSCNTSAGPGYRRSEQWGSTYTLLLAGNNGNLELVSPSYTSPLVYMGCYSSPAVAPNNSYSTLANTRSMIIDVSHY